MSLCGIEVGRPIRLLAYAVNRHMMQYGYELVPFTYVFAQFVYLLIARRMVLYNVSEMVIESEVQSGDTGFITMDIRERYLGSNKTASREGSFAFEVPLHEEVSG